MSRTGTPSVMATMADARVCRFENRVGGAIGGT
jgi:hypothetical protein